MNSDVSCAQISAVRVPVSFQFKVLALALLSGESTDRGKKREFIHREPMCSWKPMSESILILVQKTIRVLLQSKDHQLAHGQSLTCSRISSPCYLFAIARAWAAVAANSVWATWEHFSSNRMAEGSSSNRDTDTRAQRHTERKDKAEVWGSILPVSSVLALCYSSQKSRANELLR